MTRSDTLLDQVRALGERASPRPWRHGGAGWLYDADEDEEHIADFEPPYDANAAYTALAVNTFEALVEAVEVASEVLHDLSEADEEAKLCRRALTLVREELAKGKER